MVSDRGDLSPDRLDPGRGGSPSRTPLLLHLELRGFAGAGAGTGPFSMHPPLQLGRDPGALPKLSVNFTRGSDGGL